MEVGYERCEPSLGIDWQTAQWQSGINESRVEEWTELALAMAKSRNRLRGLDGQRNSAVSALSPN